MKIGQSNNQPKYKEVEKATSAAAGLSVAVSTLTGTGAALAAPTGLSAIGVALGVTSTPIIMVAAPIVAAIAAGTVAVAGLARFYSYVREVRSASTRLNR